MTVCEWWWWDDSGAGREDGDRGERVAIEVFPSPLHFVPSILSAEVAKGGVSELPIGQSRDSLYRTNISFYYVRNTSHYNLHNGLT